MTKPKKFIDATSGETILQLIPSTGLVLVLALFGCSDDMGAEAEVGTESGIEGDAARGEELYAACAGCHGPDGAGGIDIGGTLSSDLRDEIPEMTEAELADVIENGDGAMPPQYDDPQDIADMIAYLVETFP
jgi:mono/diheme cytochrome c family protein